MATFYKSVRYTGVLRRRLARILSRFILSICFSILVVTLVRIRHVLFDPHFNSLRYNLEDITSPYLLKETLLTNYSVKVVTSGPSPVATTERSVSFQLFNASCPTDFLGLPEYVSTYCPEESTESLCTHMTCRNLLSREGSSDVLYGHAREFMSNHTRATRPDESLEAATTDCGAFRRERGYDVKSAIEEDGDFSIAFNLIVHRNAEQVERLVYGLYRKQHQFCVHIDTKASRVFKMALHAVARCLPNVFIASKLENIVYGGISRLLADINCMKDHLARGSNWRYIINTAGEAYPLRSQREMIHILRLYNGSNDIEGIYGADLRHRRKFFEGEFIEDVKHREMIRTGRKNPKPPHDIDIVKGSAYGVFSRAFVQFVVSDQRARDLLQWCERTYSPDELYWSTLHSRYVNPHLNAPGGYSGLPTQSLWSTVYVNWGDVIACQGTVVHEICVNGVADIPNFIYKRDLFANKFYTNPEPLSLDCLRAWVEHKEFCPVEYNYDFYKQLAQQRKYNVQ